MSKAVPQVAPKPLESAAIVLACALLVAHALMLGLAPWTPPLGAALQLLWWPLCHQLEARSQFAGVAWPVCARCLGLIWGGALGSLLAVFARYRPSHATGLVVVCAALAADAIARGFLHVDAGPWVHWLTGLAAGIMGGAWLLRCVEQAVEESA